MSSSKNVQSSIVEINSIKFRKDVYPNEQVYYIIESLIKEPNDPNYTWREKFDEKTKRNYFIHLKTKKSTWKLPTKKDFSEEELKIIENSFEKKENTLNDNQINSINQKNVTSNGNVISSPVSPTSQNNNSNNQSEINSRSQDNVVSPKTNLEKVSQEIPNNINSDQQISSTLKFVLSKIATNSYENITVGDINYHKVVYEGKKKKIYLLQEGIQSDEALFEELFSEQHNRNYYKNEKTKKTSWSLPKTKIESQPNITNTPNTPSTPIASNDKNSTESQSNKSLAISKDNEAKNNSASIANTKPTIEIPLSPLSQKNLSSPPNRRASMISPNSPKTPQLSNLNNANKRLSMPAEKIESENNTPKSTLKSPSSITSLPLTPINDSPIKSPLTSSNNNDQIASKEYSKRDNFNVTNTEDIEVVNGIQYLRIVENNQITLQIKGQTAPEFTFKEKFDNKTNKKYYINMKTKKSTWKLPKISDFNQEDIKDSIVKKDSDSASVNSVSTSQSRQSLPPGETIQEKSTIQEIKFEEQKPIALSPNPSIDTPTVSPRIASISQEIKKSTSHESLSSIQDTKSIASTDTFSTLSTQLADSSSVNQESLSIGEIKNHGLIFVKKIIKQDILLNIKGTNEPKYTFKEKFDKKTNRNYYVNMETKKSVWKLPKLNDFTIEEQSYFNKMEESIKNNINNDTVTSKSSSSIIDNRRNTIANIKSINDENLENFKQELKNQRGSVQISNEKMFSRFRTGSTASVDSHKFSTGSTIGIEGQSEGSGSPSSPADDLKKILTNQNSKWKSSFKLKQPPSRRSSSPVSVDSNDTESTYSDFQDIDLTRRLSFGIDAKMPGDYSKGTLETTIEHAIFHRVGGGDVHTLVAIDAYIYEDASHIQKKQKGKQRIIICIARDFCGAFGLFIFDKKVSKAKSYHTSLILHSFPLAEGAKIKDLETVGTNCQFQLIVNDTILTFLTEIQLRNRLSNSLTYVQRSLPSFNIYEKFRLRLAMTDFVQTYHIPTIPPDAIDTASLIRSLISIRDRNQLDILKNVIRDPIQRDFAMEALSDILSTTEFNTTISKNFFSLLKEIIRIVTPTKLPHLRQLFISNLLKLSNLNKPILREYDIPELIRQLNAMFDAQEDWEGRGCLPAISFQSELFLPDFSGPKSKFLDRSRTKKSRNILNSVIQDGVYISVLIHTNNLVVASTKSYGIPYFPVKRVSWNMVSNMTIDNNEDFAWLHSFGKFSSELVNTLWKWAQSNEVVSIFLKGFIETLNDIINQYKFTENLGYLLDSPVQLSKDGKSIVFVFSLNVEKESNFQLPKDYQWKDLLIFEHTIYQKLYEIEETSRLEHLNHGLYGERWIYSAISHEESISKSLNPGFYIAHLRILANGDDNFILITDENRSMIPYKFVQDVSPTQDEWRELSNRFLNLGSLHLTDDFLLGENFIPNEDTRFYECKTFWQRFYLSWHLLAQKLNVDDLGQLFFIQPILIDEVGKYQFCIFYHIVDDANEMEESYWKYNFHWRKQSILENSMNLKFNFQINLLRKKFELNQKIEKKSSYISSISIDENIRHNLDLKEAFPVMQIDKLWIPFQWMNFVYDFSQYPKEDTYQKVIYEQWFTYLSSQRMKLINQSKNAKTWEEIILHFNELETKEKDNLMHENPISVYIDPVPEFISWENISPLDIVTDRNISDIENIDTLIGAPSSKEIASSIVDFIIEDSFILYFEKKEIEECAMALSEIIDIIEQKEIEEDEQYSRELIEMCKIKVMNERQNFKKKILTTFYNTITLDDLSEDINQIEVSYEPIIRKMITSFDEFMNESDQLLQIIGGVQNTLELMEHITSSELTMDNYEFFTESTILGEKISKKEMQSLGFSKQMINNMLRNLPPLAVPLASSPELSRLRVKEEISKSGVLNGLTSIDIFVNERRRIDEYERMHKESLERVGKQYREGFPNYQRGPNIVRF